MALSKPPGQGLTALGRGSGSEPEVALTAQQGSGGTGGELQREPQGVEAVS